MTDLFRLLKSRQTFRSLLKHKLFYRSFKGPAENANVGGRRKSFKQKNTSSRKMPCIRAVL